VRSEIKNAKKKEFIERRRRDAHERKQNHGVPLSHWSTTSIGTGDRDSEYSSRTKAMTRLDATTEISIGGDPVPISANEIDAAGNLTLTKLSWSRGPQHGVDAADGTEEPEEEEKTMTRRSSNSRSCDEGFPHS
jgi:hypothetical protein